MKQRPATVEPLPLICASCGQRPSPGIVLSKCSACHTVFYCGIPCQRADWVKHKALCKAAAADEAAQIASYMATTEEGGALCLARGRDGTIVQRLDLAPVPVATVPETIAGLAHRDSRLLHAACGAVSTLVMRSDDNRAALVRAGAVPLLVAALAKHAANARVTEAATEALLSLFPNQAEAVELRGYSSATPHILDALLTHSADSGIVRAAASVLYRLFQKNGRMDLAEAGRAVPLVVRALAAHSLDHETSYSLCGVIANLAMNDTFEVALTRAGVIPLLLAVLGRHACVGGERVIAMNACRALKNLAYNPAHKSVVGHSGVAPLLLVTLTSHASDDLVVDAACGVLDSITRVASTCVVLLEAGALPVLRATAAQYSATSPVGAKLRNLIWILERSRRN